MPLDIRKRLTEVQSTSVNLYLSRQQIHLQIQQLQLKAAEVEQELLKLDGEERLLLQLVDSPNPDFNLVLGNKK